MKPILLTAFLIGAILCSPMARRTDEVALGNQKRSIASTMLSSSPYLFVWAADEDQKESDFLAVIDASPTAPTYGQVITTLPIGARATRIPGELPPS